MNAATGLASSGAASMAADAVLPTRATAAAAAPAPVPRSALRGVTVSSASNTELRYRTDARKACGSSSVMRLGAYRHVA